MMIGEARYVLAPDRLECEFALSVADDWRSKGLSTLLMADIECRARSIGARHLGRDILRSNEPMKALARKNGFLMADVPRDARLVRIMKDLALTRVARLCEALRASDRNGLRRVRVPAAIGQGLIALTLCSMAFVDAD